MVLKFVVLLLALASADPSSGPAHPLPPPRHFLTEGGHDERLCDRAVTDVIIESVGSILTAKFHKQAAQECLRLSAASPPLSPPALRAALRSFVQRAIAALNSSCTAIVTDDVFGALVGGYAPNRNSLLFSKALKACVKASNVEAAAVHEILSGMVPRLQRELRALSKLRAPPHAVVPTLAAAAARVLALEGDETLPSTLDAIRRHFETALAFGSPLTETCSLYALRVLKEELKNASDSPTSLTSALMAGAPRVMGEVLLCGIASSLPLWPKEGTADLRLEGAHINAQGEAFVADFSKINNRFRPLVRDVLRDGWGSPSVSNMSFKWIWGGILSHPLASAWLRFASAVEVETSDPLVAAALSHHLLRPEVIPPPSFPELTSLLTPYPPFVLLSRRPCAVTCSAALPEAANVAIS
jgi:hypothetical protein